jgi:N utilization substance protein B
MATPRDIRRLAFQILYQLDARGADADGVRGGAGIGEAEMVSILDTLGDDEDGAGRLTINEREKAFALASEAYGERAGADAFMTEAAPGWPAHRQAAVDRAILRLAYHEMTSGKTPPKIAVNEAVELAKEFSTEKSPAFVNGLLDKALKKVLGEEGSRDQGIEGTGGEGSRDQGIEGSSGEPPSADADAPASA